MRWRFAASVWSRQRVRHSIPCLKGFEAPPRFFSPPHMPLYPSQSATRLFHIMQGSFFLSFFTLGRFLDHRFYKTSEPFFAKKRSKLKNVGRPISSSLRSRPCFFALRLTINIKTVPLTHYIKSDNETHNILLVEKHNITSQEASTNLTHIPPFQYSVTLGTGKCSACTSVANSILSNFWHSFTSVSVTLL
jgi:hypothetical protein